MKPEDYPLVIFEGRRLRRVRELPRVGNEQKDDHRVPRCAMCAAQAPEDADVRASCCMQLSRMEPTCTDYGAGGPGIYVPEDRFQDYVVEFIRRRIS